MNAETSSDLEARSAADWAFFLYQRAVCGFLLLLIGVTWPLWVPTPSFPAVPVLELLCSVPVGADWVLLGLIVVSSAALLIVGPTSTWSGKLWLLLAAGLVGSFLLNQHRFQPWAYQMAVLAAFFGLARPASARQLAFWLTLSIYFYSALSKLNPSFVDELGSDFLWTLSSLLGLKWNAAEIASWKWLALAFPVFELTTFLLLLSRRTRRAGVIAACLMHAGLLLILGPLGLAHSWGVLLWNLFFIVQVVLLFWFPRKGTELSETPVTSAVVTRPRRNRLAQAILVIVLLFPALELIGLGDPWPAWGLYASHVGRTYLFLPSHAIGALPPDMQEYVAEELGDQLYVPVRLDRWSLDRTGAPIYPGPRFAFAVARAFMAKTGTGNFARLIVESPAGRFRGERQSETIAGSRVSQEAEERFWLNTKARNYYLAAPR